MVTHDELMERIVRWARDEDNVRAVIQTGSGARSDASKDEFSDRDVEIICRDPQPLLDDDAWIHAIAPVWVSLYLANPDRTNTRLVFFEGPRKIDFSVSGLWRIEEQLREGLNSLYDHGYSVLVDKDGLAAGLPAPTMEPEPFSRPTQQEFAAVVNEFWFEAAHMPTYLSREDYWVVKFRDWSMKQLLLQVLEWHSKADSGDEAETWYIGTKMKRWLDPETWGRLDGIWGEFRTPGAYRAIVAQLELFRDLTHRVADAWGTEYDRSAEKYISAYVASFASRFGQT